MPDRTKIATCSYCGARTMLQATARDGHELACASCGAPLHEMKWLRTPEGSQKPKRATKSAPGYGRTRPEARSDYYAKRKKKRRKPVWQKALGEAFDLIEDIFD